MRIRQSLNHSSIMAGSLILLLVVTGCKDFFGTEDLKETIREDAQIATAAEVQVVLRAERDTMGTPSPYGTQTVKVGVPYEITTTVGQDYSFLQWTHSGEDGVVEFADAGAITTTMTVTQEVSDIVIAPTFDRRPYPVTWDPYSGNTGVYTNKTITLTFNEPVDASTVTLGESQSIEISTWSQTGGAEAAANPEHIEESITLSLDGSVVTLTPIPGQWFSPYHAVLVELTETIADLNGNTMAQPFNWFFYTGAGRDSAAPVLTRYAILRSDGEVFDSESVDAQTNSSDIQIIVNAQDEDQVPYLRIIENYDGGDPIETELTYSTDPIPYTIDRTGDGDATIQIQVADTFKNWSTPEATFSDDPDVDVGNTKTVTLDTAAPAVSGFSVGSAEFTNTRNVSITAGTADGTGTDVVGWKLSESSGTPSSWESSAPTTMTLSTGDGLKTVYLHVKDAAGNTGYGTDTIVLDQSGPTISGFSLSSDSYTYSTVINPIDSAGTAEDVLSGVAGYELSESSTPSGSWVPVNSWSADRPTSVTLSGGDGLKTVYLHVIDGAGNTAYDSDQIDLDQNDPVISGYTDRPTATNSGTVNFAVNASDTAPYSVVLYEVLNVSGIDSGYSGAGSSVTFTLDTGSEGTKQYSVRVTDENDRTASSGTLSVIYDSVDPTVSGFSVGSGEYTDTRNVGVTPGTANGTGTSVVGWRLSESVATPGSWESSAPIGMTLSDGDELKTVYLHVRDAAGNTAYVSDTITLDETDPTISGFSLSSDSYTYSTLIDPIDSAGTAEDVLSGVAGYELSESSTPSGSWVPVNSWSADRPTSVTLSGGDGLKTVYLHVIDGAGNTAYDSDQIDLDQNDPVISGYTDRPTATNSGTVNFAVNASDTAPYSVVLYEVLNVSGIDSGYSGAGSSVTFTLDTGSEGTKQYSVRVTDENDRTASSGTLSVIYDSVDPTVSGFSVGSGEYTDTRNVGVTPGTANGTGTSVVGWRLSESVATPGSWESSAPIGMTLSDGDELKTVYLHVRDAAGNTAYVSDTITLDETDPTISGFSLSSDSYTYSTLIDPIDSAGTAEDVLSGVAGYELSESSTPSGSWVPVNSWSADRPTSVTLSGGDGLKTVYLHVIDGAGNTAYDSDQIDLDQNDPVISGYTDRPTATNSGTVNFAVNASDTAPYSVVLYEVLNVSGIDSGYSGAGSSVTFTLDTGSEGTKQYSVRVTDENDRTASSGTLTVIYDITSPEITDPSISAAVQGDGKVDVTGLSTQDPVGGSGINVSAYTSTHGTFDGTQLLDVPAPADGNSVDVTITAEDNAGNPVSAIVRVTNSSGSYSAVLNP